MKTILNSLVAGSLLTTLAVAQTLRSEGPLNTIQPLSRAEVQPAPSQADPLTDRRQWNLRSTGASSAVDRSSSAGANLLVYIINVAFQFGAVDLRSGSFLPIGPGLPMDVGVGLVPGKGTSLLTLAFSGDLDAIDPRTGVTSVVGPTGLGDCTTPASPCGPDSANVIGRLDGRFYAMDFANNLYSVDPRTGAAELIGPTGIPAIPFIPFTSNPDGTINVYAESLFSARGKLYADFSASTVNPATGALTPVIPGALYHINPATGHATLIAPADTNLSCFVNVNDTIYAFNAGTGQVVTVDLTNGQTTAVSEASSAGIIVGATPARPVPRMVIDHPREPVAGELLVRP